MFINTCAHVCVCGSLQVYNSFWVNYFLYALINVMFPSQLLSHAWIWSVGSVSLCFKSHICGSPLTLRHSVLQCIETIWYKSNIISFSFYVCVISQVENHIKVILTIRTSLWRNGGSNKTSRFFSFFYESWKQYLYKRLHVIRWLSLLPLRIIVFFS